MKRGIIGFLLLLVLGIIILPTLIPTHFVVDKINGTLRGTLKVEKLSLSWLGSQEASGITYAAPGGAIEFQADRIRTNLSLFVLLKGLAQPISRVEIEADGYTLFQGMLLGKNPLTVELEDLDLLGQTVKSGVIKVGKVLLSENRRIASVMRHLKLDGNKNILIWATPIYFSMNRGKIAAKRFDFLVADTTPMALWGKINLNKDKLHFTLALSTNTIESLIGLQGMKGMVQIPLKGTKQKIQIDEASALVRLGKEIFGENALPPPTTEPFPWLK